MLLGHVKPFALILVAAALAPECGTSSAVSQSPSAVKCQVTLATAPMMDAGSGSGSLAITTQPECAWDVSSNVTWISGFTPASGQGNSTVTFRVTSNDGSAQRDGMIVVNGEQARVSQRASCRYDVGPSNQMVNSSGGAGSINVATTSDCSWSAASQASWINITSSPSGSGNGTISFVVTPNQGDTRSSSIVVANQRADITQSGVVSAPPPACTPSISPMSQNVAAGGGTGTVTVSATCQWTATSSASWITITSGARGNSNGTVAFSVASNTGAARTGTLNITGRTFTVSQAGTSSPTPPAPSPPTPSPPAPNPPAPNPPAQCSYSISPSRQTVGPNAGSATISISTGNTCAWTASSGTAWITLTSGRSGTGNGTVTFSYPQNPDASDRAGAVTVAGTTAVIEQRHGGDKKDGNNGEGNDDKDHKGDKGKNE